MSIYFRLEKNGSLVEQSQVESVLTIGAASDNRISLDDPTADRKVMEISLAENHRLKVTIFGHADRLKVAGRFLKPSAVYHHPEFTTLSIFFGDFSLEVRAEEPDPLWGPSAPAFGSHSVGASDVVIPAIDPAKLSNRTKRLQRKREDDGGVGAISIGEPEPEKPARPTAAGPSDVAIPVVPLNKRRTSTRQISIEEPPPPTDESAPPKAGQIADSTAESPVPTTSATNPLLDAAPPPRLIADEADSTGTDDSAGGFAVHRGRRLGQPKPTEPPTTAEPSTGSYLGEDSPLAAIFGDASAVTRDVADERPAPPTPEPEPELPNAAQSEIDFESDDFGKGSGSGLGGSAPRTTGAVFAYEDAEADDISIDAGPRRESASTATAPFAQASLAPVKTDSTLDALDVDVKSETDEMPMVEAAPAAPDAMDASVDAFFAETAEEIAAPPADGETFADEPMVDERPAEAARGAKFEAEHEAPMKAKLAAYDFADDDADFADEEEALEEEAEEEAADEADEDAPAAAMAFGEETPATEVAFGGDAFFDYADDEGGDERGDDDVDPNIGALPPEESMAEFASDEYADADREVASARMPMAGGPLPGEEAGDEVGEDEVALADDGPVSGAVWPANAAPVVDDATARLGAGGLGIGDGGGEAVPEFSEDALAGAGRYDAPALRGEIEPEMPADAAEFDDFAGMPLPAPTDAAPDAAFPGDADGDGFAVAAESASMGAPEPLEMMEPAEPIAEVSKDAIDLESADTAAAPPGFAESAEPEPEPEPEPDFAPDAEPDGALMHGGLGGESPDAFGSSAVETTVTELPPAPPPPMPMPMAPAPALPPAMVVSTPVPAAVMPGAALPGEIPEQNAPVDGKPIAAPDAAEEAAERSAKEAVAGAEADDEDDEVEKKPAEPATNEPAKPAPIEPQAVDAAKGGKPAAMQEVLVSIDPRTGKPIPPGEIHRKSTVRYYTRMNPHKNFPLLVVISKYEIQQKVMRKVAQVSGKKSFAVKASNPIVQVVPRFPGSLCVPDKLNVDVRPATCEMTFWITPQAEGMLKDAKVEIWYEGACIDTIPCPCRVVKQTWARLAATAGVVSPVFFSTFEGITGQSAQQAMAVQTQTAVSYGLPWLAQQVDGFTNLGLIAGAVCLVGAGLFWLMGRPKQGDPVDSFLAFNTLQPDDSAAEK